MPELESPNDVLRALVNDTEGKTPHQLADRAVGILDELSIDQLVYTLDCVLSMAKTFEVAIKERASQS